MCREALRPTHSETRRRNCTRRTSYCTAKKKEEKTHKLTEINVHLPILASPPDPLPNEAICLAPNTLVSQSTPTKACPPRPLSHPNPTKSWLPIHPISQTPNEILAPQSLRSPSPQKPTDGPTPPLSPPFSSSRSPSRQKSNSG